MRVCGRRGNRVVPIRNQVPDKANPPATQPQRRVAGVHRVGRPHDQLPDRRRHSLLLHNRALVPAQAGLHLPVGPGQRVLDHVPGDPADEPHPAALRLHGVRQLHQQDQGDLQRRARDAEPRQAQRRAARRHKGHAQEYRGPAVPRRLPRAHGRDQLPPARRQQEVPQGRRQDQLGPAAQAVRAHRRPGLYHNRVPVVEVLLR